MCSIETNATAEAQLKSLASSNDEELLVRKLKDWAGDSSVERSGFLDLPMHHLHGMPDDLKHIRRVRTGRHRAFYVGHHTRCSYSVFYIKTFKRTGVNDELDKGFQKALKAAVADTESGWVIREADPRKDPS